MEQVYMIREIFSVLENISFCFDAGEMDDRWTFLRFFQQP